MRSKWWDNLIWIVLFIFLIPSTLAVASWNSLPGSRLYRVKLAAENAIVAIAPSNLLKGELQVSYTGKRLNEATQLITDETSGEGLAYFRSQVEEAKQAIARAPAGEARNQLTMKYVETLQNASRQLEQQKQVISQPNYVPYTPRTRSLPRSTGGGNTVTAPRQVVVVNQVNQVTQVTQVTQVVQVIQQIDQTQNQINQVISQVQSMSAEPAAPTPAPTEVPAPPTNTPVPTAAPTPEQQNVTVQSDSPPPAATETVAPTAAPQNNGNSGSNGGNHGNDN